MLLLVKVPKENDNCSSFNGGHSFPASVYIVFYNMVQFQVSETVWWMKFVQRSS